MKIETPEMMAKDVLRRMKRNDFENEDHLVAFLTSRFKQAQSYERIQAIRLCESRGVNSIAEALRAMSGSEPAVKDEFWPM